MKKTVISILQSKGGVGKSWLSALLSDLLLSTGKKVKIFDNDSETPRLLQYKGVNAEHIQLYNLDNNGHVKPESLNINAMDTITDELENGDADIIIVDNGSPSFQPFLSYFQSNTIELFNELDIEFVCVIPIAKDQITHTAPLEVLRSYKQNVKYILVENLHFGTFTYHTAAFDAHEVDCSVFTMEKYTKSQSDDIEKVQSMNLLLSEAVKSKEFNLVSKSRLLQAQKAFSEPFLQILNSYDDEE
ncbi:MAG: P-loop NTPase [Arcobacteraceae bacterium]|nr:P-loop NTPase [Arcobacteraceae bacterium]